VFIEIVGYRLAYDLGTALLVFRRVFVKLKNHFARNADSYNLSVIHQPGPSNPRDFLVAPMGLFHLYFSYLVGLGLG
jgi:hypothetical protein